MNISAGVLMDADVFCDQVWEGLNPPYATIVVDPPWPYDKVNPDNPRMNQAERMRATYVGGGLPYQSMSLVEIASLPVEDLAGDSRLFLWTTNRFLRFSWDIMQDWGFEPHDRILVWCKTPRGTMPVTTEFILIGKRGDPPRMPWHGTTWFNWPLQIGRGHSAKPAAFYDLIESWCPGPYVDVFSRDPRLGWDSWGYGYESAVG